MLNKYSIFCLQSLTFNLHGKWFSNVAFFVLQTLLHLMSSSVSRYASAAHEYQRVISETDTKREVHQEVEHKIQIVEQIQAK